MSTVNLHLQPFLWHSCIRSVVSSQVKEWPRQFLYSNPLLSHRMKKSKKAVDSNLVMQNFDIKRCVCKGWLEMHSQIMQQPWEWYNNAIQMLVFLSHELWFSIPKVLQLHCCPECQFRWTFKSITIFLTNAIFSYKYCTCAYVSV